MENGPRRSGRARKQVKTLAGEQAEAAELAAATLPNRKKQRKSKTAVKNETQDGATDLPVKTEEYQPDTASELPPLPAFESADDESTGTVFEDEEPRPKKRKKASKKSSALKNGNQLYNAPPEGTMIPW